MSEPSVISVHRSEGHSFSKAAVDEIVLVAGLGVTGDAHSGARVRHRSRVRADPSQPNLRQVHLMHAELHDELKSLGYSVAPGDLGENVTTRGVDLLSLSTGTVLKLGHDALVAVTGLRNPCDQIEGFQHQAASLADTLDVRRLLETNIILATISRLKILNPGVRFTQTAFFML